MNKKKNIDIMTTCNGCGKEVILGQVGAGKMCDECLEREYRHVHDLDNYGKCCTCGKWVILSDN